MDDLASLADESYCYLTTTGRVSGEPREIEIWFALDGTTLYMLSGGRDGSDWVKNLLRAPRSRCASPTGPSTAVLAWSRTPARISRARARLREVLADLFRRPDRLAAELAADRGRPRLRLIDLS